MAGFTRKVLVRPDRNGYIYVIDRTTGQVLSATPYVYTTTTKGVDLKTGQLIHVDEKKPEIGQGIGEHLPDGSGVEGLAALVVFPTHRTGLYSARKHVHGRAGQRSRTTLPEHLILERR